MYNKQIGGSMNHRESTWSGIWTAAFAFAGLMAGMGANAQTAKVNYQIAGGDASKALKDFAAQSHLQILFDYQVVKALQTQPVHGPFEPEDALGTLLSGTGLTFQQVNARTVAIRRAESPAATVAPDSPIPQSGVPQDPLGVAQSERIDELLFDDLCTRDAHLNVQPGLAERWEIPDPLTYVFHLHTGLRVLFPPGFCFYE